MPIITNNITSNLTALNVPDVYVRIVPPPGYTVGVPSNVIAIGGTASWGPLNSPVLISTPQDIIANFGGITPEAVADNFDLCTHLFIALAQAQVGNPYGLQVLAFRVANGSPAKATATLLDTSGTPKDGLEVTAVHSGKRGNDIKIYVSAGSKTGTFNVNIVPWTGAQPEYFRDIAGGGAGVFWNNLKTAINQGQNSVRPKSQLIVAGDVDATAIDPALSTYTLSGGTDGRSVNTSDCLGADGNPGTGIYCLRGAKPAPKLLWVSGLTDRAADPTIQAFVNSEAMIGVLTMPSGKTTAQAVSDKKAAGMDDPNIFYTKDWVYWFDTFNGLQRLVAPTPFIGGMIGSLAPEVSPTNKSVYQVIATERLNRQLGEIPYGHGEIGQLRDNGILVITNPTIGSDRWGVWHGFNTSTDEVRKVIEYATMTNWLAHSIETSMRKYVGRNQSTRVVDPLRADIKAELDGFFEELKVLNQIDNHRTVCDKSNNPDDMIAKHYIKADAFVRYMSSAQYVMIDLMGGTTVKVEIQPLAVSA